MLREELAVDQPMVVWQGTGGRHRHDAKVAKVAKKYVTLEVTREGTSSKWTSLMEFDIKTQKERGRDDHYAAIFRTVSQQEAEDRQSEADKDFRELGLSFLSKRTLTLDEMEEVITVIRARRVRAEVRETAYLSSGRPPWIPE